MEGDALTHAHKAALEEWICLAAAATAAAATSAAALPSAPLGVSLEVASIRCCPLHASSATLFKQNINVKMNSNHQLFSSNSPTSARELLSREELSGTDVIHFGYH